MATTLSRAYSGTYIDITDTGTGTHTIHLYSFPKVCYQQESISTPISIGASDASTEWQKFSLPHLWVLPDTLVVTINSETWTLVDSFIESTSSSKHFKLLYNKNGKTNVLFGNGVYGKIPAAFDIFVLYATGGGWDGNVSVVNKINLYSGANTNIEGCSNPSFFTGGDDEETIENAKYLAPLLLKARDRFVTVADGEALVLAYGGVSRVNIIKNAYGTLSAQVVIIPTGGGAPSGTLKTEIDTYLTNKSILESIDIRVTDPTYNTRNGTGAMKMKEGYIFADELKYYTLLVRLIFSEVTYDIYNTYLTSGIAVAVIGINTKWSTSFVEQDYIQIQKMLDNLDIWDMIPDFGQIIQESELLGIVNGTLDGCDYCTWASPAFPIICLENEINTAGTMTLTEI